VQVEGTTAQRVTTIARDRGKLGTAVCLAAVALVAWPVHSIRPAGGVDSSWIAALAYVAHHGLDFGDQVVWSFGPLGFLNTWGGPALYYGDIFTVSWLFAALIQLLLAGTLLVALRRSLPLGLAMLVAVVVLALASERPTALGFAWCALALTRGDDPPRDAAARWFPVAIGVLTGIGVLGKLNEGVGLLALAVIALAAIPRRRDVLAFAGTLLATVLAGWLLSGQPLGGVWSYLRYGVEVVAGYAEAMGTSSSSLGWTYVAALALGALALACAWTATREARPRRRWCLLALCAVYLAVHFKESFVRQDRAHLQVFFGSALVLFAVLPLHPRLRPAALGGVLASVAALGVLIGGHNLLHAVDPVANARAAADQLRTLVSPARRAEIVADTRARVIGGYLIPPKLAAVVGRRSVMLWPFAYGEIAVAYDLNLRLLPTLEPYAAYTPTLDRLAGEMLASARAPERIIRALPSASGAVDERYVSFEAPLATRQIFCRYRQLTVHEPWQVLARIPHSRCGAARTLSTVAAPWDEAVPVPAPARPDALLLVKIAGADPHGLERLKELAVRPSERLIALDEVTFRLIPATAGDGLLLSAPPGSDYPGRFAMAPHPNQIGVIRVGGQPDGDLRYTFFEVSVDPFPRAGRE
jgi:hypothetical protein